jgi:hypothetical protein
MGPQARNTSKITDCGRSLIIGSVPATRYGSRYMPLLPVALTWTVSQVQNR